MFIFLPATYLHMRKMTAKLKQTKRVYNFNFGKTYSFIFPCKFRKTYNSIFRCEFAKNVFLYKKYIRDYIQLYSQPYLSEVYSEHFFFFYNIFFTKSKIILLILLKTFLLVCCKFTLNLY